MRAINSPQCPQCGSIESRVMGRFTSQENDCVRNRRCQDCGHRWRTLQPPEEVLDASIRVKFPQWLTPDGSRKRVTLEYGP